MPKPIDAASDAARLATLRCKAVRSMANAVFAQPLLRMDSGEEAIDSPAPLAAAHSTQPLFCLDEHWPWLQQLDANPDHLLAALELAQQKTGRRRPKLGELHEWLWQYFLAHNGRTQLLASNLKVRNHERDIGEFDIVYRDSSNTLAHLELACKYYLASASQARANTGNPLGGWIGPGRRDWLDRKVTHSVERQLQLAVHPAALALLRELAGPQANSLRRQLHVGGRLFYPAGDPVCWETPGLNPALQRGQWLRYSDWQAETTAAKHWRVVIKPWWMDNAPLEQVAASEIALERSLDTRAGPVLIQQQGDGGVSDYRFIVPDDWDDGMAS